MAKASSNKQQSDITATTAPAYNSNAHSSSNNKTKAPIQQRQSQTPLPQPSQSTIASSSSSSSSRSTVNPNPYAGYWTPERRRALRVFGYSWPVVVACSIVLYKRFYDDETRERWERYQQQKNGPLNKQQQRHDGTVKPEFTLWPKIRIVDSPSDYKNSNITPAAEAKADVKQ